MNHKCACVLVRDKAAAREDRGLLSGHLDYVSTKRVRCDAEER